MKFLHLSDLHIHTCDCDNSDVTSTLRFIEKTYPDHLLIITGDITDDGTEAQYENARSLLAPFKEKIFICPGNHDFGEAGNVYRRDCALHFDTLAEELRQGGVFKGAAKPVVNRIQEDKTEVMLIALDSNLETQSIFDFACGEIGKQQLNDLNELLTSESGNGAVKVLFFHHHPFMFNDPFMELRDAKDLAKIIYGKIDLVLFGHKHEAGQWQKTWNTRCMLASDNSPGKCSVREITIDSAGVSVASVPAA